MSELNDIVQKLIELLSVYEDRISHLESRVKMLEQKVNQKKVK